MRRKILLHTIALLCIVPFALMLLRSVQGSGGGFSLIQYGLLLQSPRFFRAFWNSVVYTGVILLFNLPLSLLAAYAFSRFNFRGRWPFFWLYILMMLLPFQATMVPQYMTLKWMGLTDTPWSVVLPNIFSTFGTFLMTQYMRAFDRSIYEAAEIDGMGSFTVFMQLVLPVTKPVIASTAVLSFVNYWSLIEQPSLFLSQQVQQPLAIRLSSTDFSAFANAGGVVFSILPLLLYIYNFDALQQGIRSLSAVGTITNAKKHRRRRRPMRVLTIFFAAMLLLTLTAQKAGDVMTPKVTTYAASRRPQALYGYQTVIPAACVRDGVVYRIDTDRYDGISQQATAIQVQVVDSAKGYVALRDSLMHDVVLVCHSTRPIQNGDTIQVIGEAFAHE